MSLGQVVFVCPLVILCLYVPWSNCVCMSLGQVVFVCPLVKLCLYVPWSNCVCMSLGQIVFVCPLVKLCLCVPWSYHISVPFGHVVFICSVVMSCLSVPWPCPSRLVMLCPPTDSDCLVLEAHLRCAGLRSIDPVESLQVIHQQRACALTVCHMTRVSCSWQPCYNA